jgi:XTP/dITP diphosphohydrolase
MSPKESNKKFRLKGRVIFFATNNINKFNEARRVLTEYNIAVGMLRVKSLEIQAEGLEEIAAASVNDAFERCRLPMIVEDAGLFVDALNGFPGPYAAYVYKTIGNQGLLRLMQNVNTRRARFQSIIAYLSEDLISPKCFCGQVEGEIVTEERRDSSNSGFGFDPLFKPLRASRTFAEMTIDDKNAFSHRAQAFRAFAEWYKT